jgi:CheY-like chemotaxis protein
VRLEVLDTGIGIARDELPLIFSEFYQVGVDATVSRQGYGLGLGIVQRMATLLQADIEVESEVGKGSRFSLTLPASDIDLTKRDESTAKYVSKRGTTQSTILLVEDDPSVRASMELLLKVYGHRIVTAASLDQALDVLYRGPQPELLITDFHLPGGKTGADVIDAVRETLGEHFPAIMISGDTSPEMGEFPHDAYLRFASKPIDADSLVALAEELLVQGGIGVLEEQNRLHRQDA